MNINDIKQQIAMLSEKIREQSKKISQEELNLILSDIREFYEKTVVLNYLKSNEIIVEQSEIPITIGEVETQENPESKDETSRDVQIGRPYIPVEKEPADIKKTEKSGKDKITEDVTGDGGPQMELFSSPIRGQEQETSINEKASLRKDVQSIASELERKPITNLKSAIGINEKFLFINELFGGSTDDYNNSINHLNQCKDHAEANVYINDNLKNKYNWDEENNAVSVFLDLVGRRYTT